MQVLKGAVPITGRPGASLEPLDFSALEDELEKTHGVTAKEVDVMSAALYPKVSAGKMDFLLVVGVGATELSRPGAKRAHFVTNVNMCWIKDTEREQFRGREQLRVVVCVCVCVCVYTVAHIWHMVDDTLR